jgi:hypothetical protein
LTGEAPQAPASGRRGSYAVAKLIERHGDMTMIELRERLTADCPNPKARNCED